MRIPKDVIMIWPSTNASIPSGWSRETALDGKFPKAWGIQNPNEIGGADTHSHTTQPHSHTLANHTHTYTIPYDGMIGVPTEYRPYYPTSQNPQPCHAAHSHTGTTGNNITSTTSSDSFTTGAGSNIPPYYDLIFIKAGLSSVLQQNIIALWGGWNGNNNPPSNWQECNGANGSPDLRGKYLRGANNGADAGTTGGSLTHSHNLTHGHTGSSHNHGQTTSGIENAPILQNTGSWCILERQHTHTFTPGDAFVSVDNFTQTVNFSENVEPEYKKLLAIQFKTGAIKEKGIIGLWLGSTSNIPKGWVLCDGNNGTLDLRNKFIKIANNSSEIGQTGGSNTHTHANYSHSHTAPAHSHTIPEIDHYDGGQQHLNAPASGGSIAALRTDYHIKHRASTTDSITANWSSSDIVFNTSDNQPPYRTVAYIQFQKEIYGAGILTNFL